MAKEQGLSLNPTKISGACGRLMCCLKYEQDIYEELLKVTPKQGAIVKTPEGTGSVEYVSLLKGLVKVKLDDENEKTLKEFNVADVKVLKKGKNNEPSESFRLISDADLTKFNSCLKDHSQVFYKFTEVNSSVSSKIE